MFKSLYLHVIGFSLILASCAPESISNESQPQELAIASNFSLLNTIVEEDANYKWDTSINGIYKGIINNIDEGYHHRIVLNINNSEKGIFAIIRNRDSGPEYLKGRFNEDTKEFEFKNATTFFKVPLSTTEQSYISYGVAGDHTFKGFFNKELSTRLLETTPGDFDRDTGSLPVGGFWDVTWTFNGTYYEIFTLTIEVVTSGCEHGTLLADNPLVDVTYKRNCIAGAGGGIITEYVLDASIEFVALFCDDERELFIDVVASHTTDTQPTCTGRPGPLEYTTNAWSTGGGLAFGFVSIFGDVLPRVDF